jgi:hypothetical protein
LWGEGERERGKKREEGRDLNLTIKANIQKPPKYQGANTVCSRYYYSVSFFLPQLTSTHVCISQ